MKIKYRVLFYEKVRYFMRNLFFLLKGDEKNNFFYILSNKNHLIKFV